MSAPEPVAYQSAAIEKISKSLTTLLNADQGKDRLIVFKAPTGSGKTLMVGSALADAFADAFAKPSKRKFIVLWLSPGKGDLHVQSAKALDWMLGGTRLKVRLLNSGDDIVRYQDPSPGTVFVVNWEKLRSANMYFTPAVTRSPMSSTEQATSSVEAQYRLFATTATVPCHYEMMNYRS